MKDQCCKCGWPVADHWTGGGCPKPARKLCASCDAGLAYRCTCTDTPVDPARMYSLRSEDRHE
jgi:hypothetical protein